MEVQLGQRSITRKETFIEKEKGSQVLHEIRPMDPMTKKELQGRLNESLEKLSKY